MLKNLISSLFFFVHYLINLRNKHLSNFIIQLKNTYHSFNLQIHDVSNEIRLMFIKIDKLKIDELDIKSKLKTSILGYKDDLAMRLLLDLQKILITIYDTYDTINVKYNILIEISSNLDKIITDIRKKIDNLKSIKSRLIKQQLDDLLVLHNEYLTLSKDCKIYIDEYKVMFNNLSVTNKNNNFLDESFIKKLLKDENIGDVYNEIKNKILRN